MKTLQFKVELLSDIIINQKAASEGPNKTLDFIPGSSFLGIAASKLYASLEPEESMYIFHSGNVRFGDAHMGTVGSKEGVRGHKVPAAMFHPKLEEASDRIYISHLIPSDDEHQKEMQKAQLKQCRDGFYDFTKSPAQPLVAHTTFAIKSAYDIKNRTSKDKMMYGYESLSKGSSMYFEVELEDENYEESIVTALEGEKRVGRSRSAQYGLVRITQERYTEVPSRPGKEGCTIVYADSRLIFLDKNTGLPIFRPTAADLGLDGEINWEKSQIRTFQYAPWNYQRLCFDTDRCGIEKGSVLVVDGVTRCPENTGYVGYYRNEGFGRVIYNPSFLDGSQTDGLANTKLSKPDNEKKTGDVIASNCHSVLLQFLQKRHEEEQQEASIIKDVNEWVDKYKKLFKGKAFASQWGTIRSLASRQNDTIPLKDQLFKEPYGYLMHGVAEEKWAERGRRKALITFTKKYNDDHLLRKAIINLSAEMAKESRKEENK